MPDDYQPRTATCDFCGYEGPAEEVTKSESGRWICVDIEACDFREEREHRERMRELVRRCGG